MRDFFKTTLATLVGLTLFCTLGVAGLVTLLVAASITAKDSGPRVDDKSVLAVDLSVGITDSTAESNPSDALQEALSGSGVPQSISLRSAVNAIEAAASDRKIVGLFLTGNAPDEVGYAALRELRQALETFRKSGKPMIAYDDTWNERGYYLTSVANSVILNPSGTLEMNGLRSESMFFAGALEKFGVGVQVVRVGQFKAAVEPFTRGDSSPAARQQTEALLADIWGEIVRAAAQSRKLTPQKVQSIANTQGLLMPTEAKADGLIDKVAYADEVLSDLHKLTGEDKDEESFRKVSLSAYADLTETATQSRQQGGQIALVYLDGDIVGGAGGPGEVGGDRFAKLIRTLRQDDDVKAIVMRINSPGGSASASDLVAHEVLLATKAKPVIASMGSVAASGGYYIAARATKIFASPNTITGSIGVFGLLPNVQKLANSNGVTWDVVKTGQYADIETLSRPKTPAEMAILQRMVDQVYSTFLDVVAGSRPISRQKLADIAQGRVWSGTSAQKLGLVDQLGGLDAALDAAAEAAKLGDRWHIEEYPTRRGLEQQLLKRFLTYLPQTQQPSSLLTQELEKVQSNLKILTTLSDPSGVYTRLPFNPHIE